MEKHGTMDADAIAERFERQHGCTTHCSGSPVWKGIRKDCKGYLEACKGHR